MPTTAFLPMYDFFEVLRRSGYPLGINDYQALVLAMGAGFGLDDSEHLRRVCKALWLKNPDQGPLFDSLFDTALLEEYEIAKTSVQKNYPSATQSGTNPESILPNGMNKTDNGDSSDGSSGTRPPSSPSSGTKPEPSIGETPQTQKIKIGIEPTNAEANLIQSTANAGANRLWLLSGSYLLLKERDLTQRWRFLRQLMASGYSDNINLPATVQHIVQERILYHPIYHRVRKNQGELFIWADIEGSMVAFDGLIDTIARTALTANQQETHLLFFRNTPETWLYRNRSMTEYVGTKQWLADMGGGKAPHILIISDAGAARGNYRHERIDKISLFLQLARNHTNAIAWLNPFPQSRWSQTSAEYIARQVAMFSAQDQDFRRLVRHLKGITLKTSIP